jgi:hypothetical protein
MRYAPLVVLLALLAPPPASAEPDDPAPVPALQQQSGRDFLFGPPRGSIGVRGSWVFASAGSDWYDFVRDQLTLDRGDFKTFGVAGEGGIAISPKFDVVIGADYSQGESLSEYRRFDEGGVPIEQQTDFRQSAFTGGVRYALLGRGQTLSSLAWIPNRWVPYVGGGAGVMYYRMRQYGDFVDVADLSIFTDVFESSGWAPMGYVNGGVDVQLLTKLYLTVDARYQWAETDLDQPDWRGFEPLDLSGVRFSTGINVIF